MIAHSLEDIVVEDLVDRLVGRVASQARSFGVDRPVDTLVAFLRYLHMGCHISSPDAHLLNRYIPGHTEPSALPWGPSVDHMLSASLVAAEQLLVVVCHRLAAGMAYYRQLGHMVRFQVGRIP